MTDDIRRQIIEAVARGELTPEEAAAQLEAAEADSRPSAVAIAPPAPAAAGITAVRVESDFGSVRVYGDASVTGAVADGPHVAEQDGSTLVIRGDLTGLGGFVFNRRGRTRINIGNRSGGDRIDVRMNPQLALQLNVKAGEVRVEGVEGALQAHVIAGDVRINGFRSPFDLNVKAGEVRAKGRLEGGTSRVRCSAGQVRIDLEQGSSVRVRASARLGNVDLDDGDDTVVIGGVQERVIGGGAGVLDIETTMGQVEVRSQR